MRHPALPRWPTMLVLALLALAPLAASPDLCDDCLAGAEGCCPPGCSLCSCCGPGSWALRAGSWGLLRPADGLSFGDLAAGLPSSSHSRDVFHVPKPALA